MLTMLVGSPTFHKGIPIVLLRSILERDTLA